MTTSKALTVVPTTAEIEQAADEFERSLAAPTVPIITSPTLYEEAALSLKAVKAEQKRHTEALKKVTDPMNASLKAAKELFQPALMRLNHQEALIKDAILTYNRMVERLRAEAQARADEQRRFAEEKAERKAAALRAKGKMERAEAVLENVPPPTIVVMEKAEVKGISERTTWSAEVMDLDLLVAYAAKMHESGWLFPNPVALNAYARLAKGQAALPGVKFIEKKGIAAG